MENYYNNLLILYGKIVAGFMLLPIFTSLFRRRNLNKNLKIFLTFCIIEILILLILQIINWATAKYSNFFIPILNKWNIHDTNFIAILAYLNHFGILGWYFYLVVPNEKVAKAVKLVSIFLFFAASINYLFIEGFREYGIFNPTASAIFCFTLPLVHLWYLFNEDTKVPITKNPYFWFSMGLLIPNMLGFFLHFAGEKIYGTDFILFCKVSIGKSFFSIIGQILLAIGFYYSRYTKYLPKNTPSLND